ncbi:MAG: hypothetical protein IIY70_00390, partial [Oscillospiraceae bacterium]|nr:hypothetical protein [Oscillospiraceae bacterium]
GWRFVGDEPMKLTLDLRQAAPETATAGTGSACPPPRCYPTGEVLAAALEQLGVYCEFFDRDFLVLMLSPENSEEELAQLEAALNELAGKLPCAPAGAYRQERRKSLPERVCSLREALLSPAEQIPAGESLGRVLARPGVSCPPAVPILMPGERIDRAALASFARYGIASLSVLLP